MAKRWLARGGFIVASGLIFGLIAGLIGLISGLSSGLIDGLAMGLAFLLLFGILGALFCGLSGAILKLQPVVNFRFRRNISSRKSAVVALCTQLRSMLIAGLMLRRSVGSVGLIGALSFGLIQVFILAFISKYIPETHSVNEGTHRSIRKALTLLLIFGLIGWLIGLITGLVGTGLITGLSIGMVLGGLFALRHLFYACSSG
jgi:hypothetical protein